MLKSSIFNYKFLKNFSSIRGLNCPVSARKFSSYATGFFAFLASVQFLSAEVLWTNSFDYSPSSSRGLDASERASSSQYGGLFSKEIVLRSAKIQHQVTGNSLRLLDHPQGGRGGAIRFMNAEASGRFDLASGEFGARILRAGGFEVSFDWIPSDTTDDDWIGFSAGIRNSTLDSNMELTHEETDMGILFRNHGGVRTLDALGLTDALSFSPTLDSRNVVIRFAFDSFEDGAVFTYSAWVDEVQVVSGRKQKWGARGANGGQCFITLENWNSDPQIIDNLSIRTVETDADDDGLPDRWEAQYGLSSDSANGGLGDDGSSGNPDGDSYSNFAEHRFGTDPLVSDDLTGRLSREVWLDIPGSKLSAMFNSPKFSRTPDVIELREGAVMPRGYADNYGQRVRGWITAPATGDYTFWIAGDNECELWLSTDASKFRRVRIASVPNWSAPGQWDKFPSQQSRRISLVAGERYFVEMLHKEGSGGDHLTMAWQTPEGVSEVIPASVLSPYAEDPDDRDMDELPDSWEIAHFGSIDETPEGNPDGDFASNREEYLNGSNPVVLDSNAGYWQVERWLDILATSTTKLLASNDFYGEPTTVSKLGGSAIKSYRGFHGSRIRGYIEVDKAAEYRFWISARNAADLYLSSDETPYLKKSIARLDPDIGTGHGIPTNSRRLWDAYASQVSEPVLLEPGRKYYLEVIHQNGHGIISHTQVAWAAERGRRSLIPAANISSFVGLPGDQDDDSLPDEWEARFGLDPTDNGFLDIIRQGERGDFDLDGLANREEYVNGTDPSNPDTDGDGISDADEIRAYQTDPTVSDAPSEELVGTVDLTSYTTAGEPWIATSQGLIPPTFRGEIEWEFTVPDDGFWTLNALTTLLGDSYLYETVPIEVAIDGNLLGVYTLVYGRDRDATLRIQTPFLEAGSHRLSITSTNLIARRSVSYRGIEILRPSGGDFDEDGTPDWIEALISEENVLERYLPVSRTSPAFFEGQARMRSSAALNGAPLSEGVDDTHWFADLPLDPQGATPFTFSFEADIGHSGLIDWQATNVLESETLLLRKNDSLKLAAIPSTGSSGQSVTLELPLVNFAQDSRAVATQSNVGSRFRAQASLAIDGNTNGNFAERSVTHTRNNPGSWWEVDLGFVRDISSIHLWNRTGSTKTRLSNFRVSILDELGETVISKDYYTDSGYVEGDERWDLDDSVQGQVVRIELLGKNHFGDYVLSLAEVEVLQGGSVTLPSDAESFPYQFTQAGTHLVTASHSDGTTGTLTVDVKQADFPEVPIDLVSNIVGRVRLPLSSVDEGLFLEGGLTAAFNRHGWVVDDTLNFRVSPSRSGSFNMVARLFEGGPIIGTGPLNIIGVSDALQNDANFSVPSREFPGYSLVTTPVVATGLPEGGSLRVVIFRSGVTFRDGTTALTLTAEDFVNGVYNLEFLFPQGLNGGYCHYIRVFDRNGQLVGRR